jgi:hypothetical protein
MASLFVLSLLSEIWPRGKIIDHMPQIAKRRLGLCLWCRVTHTLAWTVKPRGPRARSECAVLGGASGSAASICSWQGRLCLTGRECLTACARFNLEINGFFEWRGICSQQCVGIDTMVPVVPTGNFCLGAVVWLRLRGRATVCGRHDFPLATALTRENTVV